MEGMRNSGWVAGSSLLVLTGGRSRRLGRDKATTHVGGRRLIDRILAHVPQDVPVVLVGPPLAGLPEWVAQTREVPPGGGPLAGIGAGLGLVRTPLVAVCAADMPFGMPLVIRTLAELADPRGTIGTGIGTDAVVPVDPEGHAHPLCAAYRTDVLCEGLRALDPLTGRPMRDLLAILRVVEWPVHAADVADVDTAEELQSARTRAAGEGTTMQRWVETLRSELGLEVPCDIDMILDLTRDASHGSDWPGAPVAAYLLGAAVAGGADPAQAASVVSRLALKPTEESL